MKWCTKSIPLIIQQKKWKRIKGFLWLKSSVFLMFSLIVVLNNKWPKDATGMNLCKFSHFLEWKNLNKILVFFSKKTKIYQILNIKIQKIIKDQKLRTFQSIKRMFSKLQQKINQKKKTTKKIKIHFIKLTCPSNKIIWKKSKNGNQNMILFKGEKGNKILLRENWESKIGRFNKICILKIGHKSKDSSRMIRFQEWSWFF